jgi:hypothetical protein
MPSATIQGKEGLLGLDPKKTTGSSGHGQGVAAPTVTSVLT